LEVSAISIYFEDSLILPLVEALQREKIEMHLWALEKIKPEIATLTRGLGLKKKFMVLNALRSFVQDSDYVLITDDDVVLPEHFVSEMLKITKFFGAEIAQPALTLDSYHSHKVTIQQKNTWARITNFVESGPVVLMSKIAFNYLTPFSKENPMGWGMDDEWSMIAQKRGWPLLIVDSCAVQHCYRPVGARYNKTAARSDMRRYLSQKQVQVGERKTLYSFDSPPMREIND